MIPSLTRRQLQKEFYTLKSKLRSYMYMPSKLKYNCVLYSNTVILKSHKSANHLHSPRITKDSEGQNCYSPYL